MYTSWLSNSIPDIKSLSSTHRRRRVLCLGLALGIPLAYKLAGVASAAELPPVGTLVLPAGKTITLAEAIELALRSHPSEQQARANLDVAAARVEESRAGYLPQVTATGQYQRTTGNFAARPGALPQTTTSTQPPSWTPAYNYFTLGATASQLIYDFGQTSGRWRSSESVEASAASSERATQVQIIANVRKAYFQARAQRDLVEVAANALANQQKHLEQIEGLVPHGMRPEIDRVTAETNVANARVQLISAQNTYAVACAALDQAIGLSAAEGHQPDNDEIGPVPEENAPFEKLLDMALHDRPEMAAFAEQRKAQEQIISANLGAYGPSLAAQAGLTALGQQLDNLAPNWWVGVLLNWPLLQGGLVSGQVREARATLRSIQAQEDAFRLSVRVDVEQASLAVQAARATLAAADLARENARKQLALAEARYTVGMGSVIELGDSQVTLTQAEGQVVNARFTLASARAALLGALGRR